MMAIHAKCRHRGSGIDLFIQHQASGEVHDATDPNSQPIAWRCVRCGDYASLGPANDGGEHAASVTTEIRAAELADICTRTGLSPQWIEYDGWQAHKFSIDFYRGEPIQNRRHWDAGWLARAIATHETPRGADRGFLVRSNDRRETPPETIVST